MAGRELAPEATWLKIFYDFYFKFALRWDGNEPEVPMSTLKGNLAFD